MHELDAHAIVAYITEMRIAKYSEVTITDRIAVLERLARHLADKPLLYADDNDLRAFQATYAHRMPATVDIYTRHVIAFYKWALDRRHTASDPSKAMILPRVRRGKPHPIKPEELRVLLACTPGYLKLVYVLAAFTGLRRGEICRAQAQHVDLTDPATMLVYGKGENERYAPLLDPVVDEIRNHGNTRGWLITDNQGRPLEPHRLSILSHHHFEGLGIDSTLHSLRHFFLTNAYRLTKDALFVRDLAGHASVATTEIYTETSMEGAHERLVGLAGTARSMLAARHLSIVAT